jgi:hypothetical protein
MCLRETKENYLKSFKYAKAQVNVLDEVPLSYSHQGNPKLDQIKCIAETNYHESMDSKVARLFSRAYAFCEEKKHAIMDVFLCIFTLNQVLLDMWNYKM